MVTAMTLRAGLILLGLGASLLAGCGDGDTVTVSSTSSLQPETTADVTPAESSTGSTAKETPSTTESDEESELIGFTSPSGNVGCFIDAHYARCDVMERDWSPPPRPADCEFDYGQGIGLAPGEEPEFMCAGDTALGGGEPLAYGQSIAAGVLRCDSAESGITCRDTKSGHGFAIAREAYRVF
jgi:uncharacterized protein DUF6636